MHDAAGVCRLQVSESSLLKLGERQRMAPIRSLKG